MEQEKLYIQELLNEYKDIEEVRKEYLNYVDERLKRIDNNLEWSCASDEFIEDDITLLEILQEIKIDDSIERILQLGTTSKEILEYLKINLKENQTAKELFLDFFDIEVKKIERKIK